jgi:hypothetical protein
LQRSALSAKRRGWQRQGNAAPWDGHRATPWAAAHDP